MWVGLKIYKIALGKFSHRALGYFLEDFLEGFQNRTKAIFCLAMAKHPQIPPQTRSQVPQNPMKTNVLAMSKSRSEMFLFRVLFFGK